MKVLRGKIVHSKSPEAIEVIEDAVIGYREDTGEVRS